MNYKLRPGILQTKICGVHVLIPSRSVYDQCNMIIRLPMLWAATISLLDQKDSEEKILKAHKILTNQSDEEIRSNVERFCEKLAENGYLIKIEHEDVKDNQMKC